jgi:hypothetical protein
MTSSTMEDELTKKKKINSSTFVRYKSPITAMGDMEEEELDEAEGMDYEQLMSYFETLKESNA